MLTISSYKFRVQRIFTASHGFGSRSVWGFRNLFLTLGIILFALCGPAYGAEIKRMVGSSPPSIVISGRIEPGDGDRFAVAAGDMSFAVVILGSHGGSLIEGLRMGQMIRRRNFATFVPDGVVCASACGFAWLGGTERFMQASSRIGFHAAYTLQDGKPVESGIANAFAGAYLAQLGLSYDAVVYVEQAHPDDMTWLTERDAAEVGISMTVLPSSSPSDAPKKIAPLITVKPFMRSIHEVAAGFPAAYFARWSEPSAAAIKFFSGIYGDQVNFFGTNLPLAVVIEKKRTFAERWPIRVYSVHPDSVRTICETITCQLTGVVDWDARSLSGDQRSAGSATFSLEVKIQGNSVKIVSETGAVIEHSADGVLP